MTPQEISVASRMGKRRRPLPDTDDASDSTDADRDQLMADGETTNHSFVAPPLSTPSVKRRSQAVFTPRRYDLATAEPMDHNQVDTKNLDEALEPWGIGSRALAATLDRTYISVATAKALKQLVSACDRIEGQAALQEALRVSRQNPAGRRHHHKLTVAVVEAAIHSVNAHHSQTGDQSSLESDTHSIRAHVTALPTQLQVRPDREPKRSSWGDSSKRQYQDQGTIAVAGEGPPDSGIGLSGSVGLVGSAESGDLDDVVDVSSDDGNVPSPPARNIFHITHDSLNLLRSHNTLLNDEIVLAMLQILQHSCGDIRVVDPLALASHKPYALTLGLRKTMIPIHVNDNHWVMAVAGASLDFVTVFDSVPDGIHRVKAEDYIRELGRRFWPQRRGRIHITHTSPIIQGDGDTYNCGIYAIVAAYAEAFGHSTPAEVDTSLMRKIAMLLLMPLEENLQLPEGWLQRESAPMQLPAQASLKEMPQILCKIYEDAWTELLYQRRDVETSEFVFMIIDKLVSLQDNTKRLGVDVTNRLCRTREFIADRVKKLKKENERMEEYFEQVKLPKKQ